MPKVWRKRRRVEDRKLFATTERGYVVRKTLAKLALMAVAVAVLLFDAYFDLQLLPTLLEVLRAYDN